MRKRIILVLIASFLLICCKEERSTTKVAIYEIEESFNTWCFCLSGHIYKSFWDTTLYVDHEGMLRSRFRPDLQGIRHSTLVLNKSCKPNFDSIIFSSYTTGPYGLTMDAVVKRDTCYAIILDPEKMIGRYSFKLTDEEYALINALILDFPHNYDNIIPTYEEHSNCSYTLATLYQDNRIDTSFIDVSINNIPQNISIISEAVWAIASWHINSASYVNSDTSNNNNRVLFDKILMGKGIPPSVPPPPPPPIATK